MPSLPHFFLHTHITQTREFTRVSGREGGEEEEEREEVTSPCQICRIIILFLLPPLPSPPFSYAQKGAFYQHEQHRGGKKGGKDDVVWRRRRKSPTHSHSNRFEARKTPTINKAPSNNRQLQGRNLVCFHFLRREKCRVRC